MARSNIRGKKALAMPPHLSSPSFLVSQSRRAKTKCYAVILTTQSLLAHPNMLKQAVSCLLSQMKS